MQTNLRKYLSYRKILKFGPCASQSVAALALFVLRAAAMLRNLLSLVLLLNFLKTFRLYRHLNYWQRAKQRCCCLLHRQARVSVVRNTLESFWCGRKIWFCREKKQNKAAAAAAATISKQHWNLKSLVRPDQVFLDRIFILSGACAVSPQRRLMHGGHHVGCLAASNDASKAYVRNLSPSPRELLGRERLPRLQRAKCSKWFCWLNWKPNAILPRFSH